MAYRVNVWATIGLLLIAMGSNLGLAQPTPNTPTPPAATAGPLDDRVDQLLTEWSKTTKNLKTLYAQFERKTKDPVWKDRTNYGEARYVSPRLARLDIENEESYILTENGDVWKYNLEDETIIHYVMPKSEGQAPNLQEDGPLPFLFCTEPRKAKTKYRFTIKSEDETTTVIKVEPRSEEDKQEFVWAIVHLNRTTFLPDKLIFREQNGVEATYDFLPRKRDHKERAPKGEYGGIYIDIALANDDFTPQQKIQRADGKGDWPIKQERVDAGPRTPIRQVSSPTGKGR